MKIELVELLVVDIGHDNFTSWILLEQFVHPLKQRAVAVDDTVERVNEDSLHDVIVSWVWAGDKYEQHNFIKSCRSL